MNRRHFLGSIATAVMAAKLSVSTTRKGKVHYIETRIPPLTQQQEAFCRHTRKRKALTEGGVDDAAQ